MNESSLLKTSKTESFVQYMKRKEMTVQSIKSYMVVAESFLSWLRKENMTGTEVRHQDILAFMKHQQKKGVSQRTVQHRLGCLKLYYNHLQENSQIKVNPVHSIKVQGVKRKILYHILEPQELHALYHNYNSQTLSGKKNKVMLGLLVYQGLKTEELDKLEVTDVKIKEGKIEVPGGRKSNARTMQLESHQVLDFYEYLTQVRSQILAKSRQQTNKLLVTIEAGPVIRVEILLKQLRKSQPKLKNADQIRASVIVKWLKQYNLREVQYLAGHRYISSTEAYQQSEMQGLTDEVNMFHPLGE
jgi:site-specific recombinase XerD